MPPGDFKDLLSGSIEEGLRHSSERLYAMGRGIWVPKEGDRRLIIPGIALPSRPRGKRSSPAPIDFINTFVSSRITWSLLRLRAVPSRRLCSK